MSFRDRVVMFSATQRSGSCTPRICRRRVTSIQLYIVTFAPTPRPRATTATSVKAGRRSICRQPYRRSCVIISILLTCSRSRKACRNAPAARLKTLARPATPPCCRATQSHSCQRSARHWRRHSRRRDGGASQRPASTIARSTPSHRRSRGPMPSRLARADFPGGERHRLQVLVAGERGGQRRGAGVREVEIAARRALVAPGDSGVLPLRRDQPERLELVERRVDGARGEARGVHDLETEAVAVRDGVEDRDGSEGERSRFAHAYIQYQPMLVDNSD